MRQTTKICIYLIPYMRGPVNIIGRCVQFSRKMQLFFEALNRGETSWTDPAKKDLLR